MRTTGPAMVLLLLAACGGDSTGSTPPPAPGPILIRGGDMGDLYENFSITRDGEPLTDATVSVNGTTIPTSATGHYNYQLPAALQAGEELVLRVEAGGDVVEGRATIITAPVFTAPTQNASVTAGQPIAVAWTATDDPDWYRVALGFVANGSGGDVRDSLGVAARQATIATSGIPAGSTEWHLDLYGYLRGHFTGPADPDSDMRVRIAAGRINLQVAP